MIVVETNDGNLVVGGDFEQVIQALRLESNTPHDLIVTILDPTSDLYGEIMREACNDDGIYTIPPAYVPRG